MVENQQCANISFKAIDWIIVKESLFRIKWGESNLEITTRMAFQITRSNSIKGMEKRVKRIDTTNKK